MCRCLREKVTYSISSFYLRPCNFFFLKPSKLKERGGQYSGYELNNSGLAESKELETVSSPFENCGQQQHFLQRIQNSM